MKFRTFPNIRFKHRQAAPAGTGIGERRNVANVVANERRCKIVQRSDDCASRNTGRAGLIIFIQHFNQHIFRLDMHKV